MSNSDRLSRDPRRWWSIFEASFPDAAWKQVNAAPADIDFVIHNRRTARVLVMEGKEADWEPSAYDGQMEVLANMHNIRTDVYVVRANWPKSKDGHKVFYDPAEALSKQPKHIEVAPITNWKRGTAGMGPWRKMTYRQFRAWCDAWWMGTGE